MLARGARAARKTKTGVVVSDKMDKTVVVAVESVRKHPLYGRTVRRTRKFKAHDPDNRVRTGDVVVIIESRPLSREKRWRVQQVVGRAEAPAEGLQEEEQP